MSKQITPGALPIETNSNLWPVIAGGMGDPMKVRMKDGKPNLSPDGRLTYSSGAILVLTNKQGVVKTEKTASVHVIEGEEGAIFEYGQRVQAQGKIWVQPYEANNRIALSITVERLVLVTAEA